jgi:hypothetical protein
MAFGSPVAQACAKRHGGVGQRAAGESATRYLGIEVDDAIEITEKIISELTRYTQQRTWSATFYASPIPDGLKSASGMTRLPPLMLS